MNPEDVRHELARIGAMPYSLARTAIAEETARRIEADGPRACLPLALLTVVQSQVWGGEPAKAFVAFAQATQLWDAHPELFDEEDRFIFFWEHKWMVGHLIEFPQIPAAQIEASLNDMARRYALAGHGMSAVAHEAFCWAEHRGTADAERLFETWISTPRDEFSQCAACSHRAEADWHLDAGRPERAIAIVEAALAAGEKCASEPATMLSTIALAYLDLGLPEQALSAHRRAESALRHSETDMAATRGRRFALLARGGLPERALRALAEDAHLLLEAESPLARLGFLTAVLSGLSSLPDRGTAIALAGIPAATVDEVRGWVHAEASRLAAAFDRRNGTDAHTRRVAAALAATPAPEPIDFTVLGPPAATPPPVQHITTSREDPSEDLARLLGNAETLVELDQLESAASAYLAAAQAAERAGLLTDAGFAYAEAAACAQACGDDPGAHRAFSDAVARLKADAVDDPHLAPVLTAWAPVAVQAGAPEPVLAELEQALVRLGRDAGEATPSNADERERRRLWADLSDTAARVLASLPAGDAAGAIEYALNAAHAYAALDLSGDAAHAFWLAGQIQRDTGRLAEAADSLQAAVTRAGNAFDEQLRAEAGSALLRILRETGQDARAAVLLRSLKPR
ncbi:MAG: hypothetical protein QM708_16250 [Propioniciclava sp.]|uniref:hypothetical protein n=1 Tax=Propioniciclava sp. TaxID=2038686 RepID=UPI0039E2C19F